MVEFDARVEHGQHFVVGTASRSVVSGLVECRSERPTGEVAAALSSICDGSMRSTEGMADKQKKTLINSSI